MNVQNDLPVAISYSGGTSSEWMIQAVIRGVIPRPRRLAVFFADTGIEHSWTWEAVHRVEKLCDSEGIWFERCYAPESLPDQLLAINAEGRTHADHPPVYIAKDGGGRGRALHKCTAYFKVAPMRRAVLLWLKTIGAPRQVIKWIGFAADEVGRAHDAVAQQIKNGPQYEKLDFPAIRLGVKRAQQKEDLRRWTGAPPPRFSCCTICPFKSPERWRATPSCQLAQVYRIDAAIRDLSNVGLTEGDAYLSDRLVPVESLIKKGDPQPYLPGLESVCDGGACFL